PGVHERLAGAHAVGGLRHAVALAQEALGGEALVQGRAGRDLAAGVGGEVVARQQEPAALDVGDEHLVADGAEAKQRLGARARAQGGEVQGRAVGGGERGLAGGLGHGASSGPAPSGPSAGAEARPRPCLSSQLWAMPSGSSRASSVKSKSARSDSEGGPMAPAIACRVTVSTSTRLSRASWWRNAQASSSLASSPTRVRSRSGVGAGSLLSRVTRRRPSVG